MLSKIFSDSLILISIRVGGMFASMLTMVLLARHLPTAEFGLVTMGFSTALLVGLLTTLNYGSGAIRYLNKYRADQALGAATRYVYTGRRITATLTLIVWCISGALYLLKDTIFALPNTVILGLIAAPLFGCIRLESAYTIAAGNVIRGSLPGMLARPLLMLAVVGLVIALTAPIYPRSVMYILIATLLIVCLWQFSLFKNSLGFQATRTSDITEHRSHDWQMMGLQLIIPMLFLELSIDTIVILTALFMTAEDVAVISVVMRIQAIILFGITSINMVIGPKIAQAHSNGMTDQVRQLLNISGQLKLWPSLLVLVALYSFGEFVLAIFGEQYRAYLGTLLIVGATPLINAIYGPTVLFMTLLELQKIGNVIFLVALSALALLIGVLGHYFGINGVAGAILLVWLGWNHALYSVIRRHGKVDTSVLSILRAT